MPGESQSVESILFPLLILIIIIIIIVVVVVVG
jgi:hypothetical protein